MESEGIMMKTEKPIKELYEKVCDVEKMCETGKVDSCKRIVLLIMIFIEDYQKNNPDSNYEGSLLKEWDLEKYLTFSVKG